MDAQTIASSFRSSVPGRTIVFICTQMKTDAFIGSLKSPTSHARFSDLLVMARPVIPLIKVDFFFIVLGLPPPMFPVGLSTRKIIVHLFGRHLVLLPATAGY